jgi:two-component system, OmpR family, heavy metal sensor histidine kinase CusS
MSGLATNALRPAATSSMARQLSTRLLVATLVLLGLLCAGVYSAAWALHERAQARVLSLKINKLSETSQSLLRVGDDRFWTLLTSNAQKRPGTRLELLNPDGSVFYRDPVEDPHLLSEHVKSRSFELPYPDAGTALKGRFSIDTQQDVQILQSLALVLLLATLAGALAAGALAAWAVRHGLRPLRLLTRQTQRISTQRLDGRLALAEPVAELQPWVDQFNQLMDRVEAAYRQLESFNADVAHELRTPLTSLIGKTELALTRPRSPDELSSTLASNLEELQRMTSLVNDMLFLSKADCGATARRGPTTGLRPVIAQVLEFHEASAAERGLSMEVSGDVEAAVDEALFQRAISNLISNASRFADPDTTVRVVIQKKDEALEVAVENSGPTITEAHLQHLFDRFYRADDARQGSDAHHGLGLAIVTAIARMHGGTHFAESGRGKTRMGFSIAAASP